VVIIFDKGYRLYVDDLMAQKEEEISLREQQVGDKEKELDSLLNRILTYYIIQL